VLSTLDLLLPTGIPLVMGTTGWYEHLNTVREKVLTSGGTLLWSSNFSIGVNLYFKLVQRAAELMNHFDEYDVWGTELHHKNKADSPSGTAKTLEHILLEKLDRKTAVIEDRLNRRIEPHEIHFSSTRGGPVNFSHTIGFDSEADTVTLTHSARNRDGYVLGALQAAEWLQGKKGFFGMEDFIAEMISETQISNAKMQSSS
jgi:4-hydroxy-tetrahydrodipicolinate reductase